MMDDPDAALLERSKAGDTQAFGELIRKHEARIYSLILSMTGNPAEAADHFQEAFLSAWKNLNGFRGNSAFSTWLYRIAVNSVLMKRRKKRVPTVSLDMPISSEGDDIERDLPGNWSENPLASLENKELKTRLNAGIAELPEKYKAVLVLSDVQGLSNDEIKRILGLSLPSVKTRLHRARLHLRQKLSDYFKNL